MSNNVKTPKNKPWSEFQEAKIREKGGQLPECHSDIKSSGPITIYSNQMNTYQLAQCLGVDSDSLIWRIQMMDTKEPVADEFQILPRDVIERVA